MRRSKGLRGRQGMRSGKEVQGGEDGAMRDDEGSMEVEGGRERVTQYQRRQTEGACTILCIRDAMPCHAMPC